MTEHTKLLVIGAGPCGLAVGVAAKTAGVSCILLDRRTVVSTIERYPLNMTFFSTPERIEIGGVPFIASHEKPTRRDGLANTKAPGMPPAVGLGVLRSNQLRWLYFSTAGDAKS